MILHHQSHLVPRADFVPRTVSLLVAFLLAFLQNGPKPGSRPSKIDEPPIPPDQMWPETPAAHRVGALPSCCPAGVRTLCTAAGGEIQELENTNLCAQKRFLKNTTFVQSTLVGKMQGLEKASALLKEGQVWICSQHKSLLVP